MIKYNTDYHIDLAARYCKYVLHSNIISFYLSIFETKCEGRGPANHKASIRLFDAPEGYEPEVTLYRDTAGW